MPQNAFFLQTRNLLVSQKTTQRHFFFTLHPISMVIFATATVLAFVLLCDSRFNFHCYTQREATPTQKLAQKCSVTSRNFLRERLQSAFTLTNQLRWITQYRRRRTRTHLKISFTWHSRSPVFKCCMDEVMLLRIWWNNHTTAFQVLEEKVTSKLLTTQQLRCRLGVSHNDLYCIWNTNDDNTVILITASKRIKLLKG